MIAFFSGSLPIECIHVLENGDLSLARHLFVEYTRKMSGSEMRFTKQNQNRGVRMRSTNLTNFVSRVSIPHADLTQVFTRHTVETVDAFGMLARRDQQFVKWRPIIAPVEIETNALPQFCFSNFAMPPFVKYVLVSGKNGFHAKDYRTISGKRPRLQQSRGKLLRGWKGVIIANQNNIRCGDRRNEFIPIDHRLIGPECAGVVLKILAPPVVVVSSDFALHASQRVKLCFGASR